MYTAMEREDFFKLIKKIAKHFENEIKVGEPISLDNTFQFHLLNKIESFSNIYSMNISGNDESLFNFEITEYDKEEFNSTLKYGFAFDQDVKDHINDEEFLCLLGEKEAYSNDSDTKAYGISLTIGKHKITDEETITKVLDEIKLKELIENLYYKDNAIFVCLNDLKNENNSVESVLIKKIKRLKNQ